MNKYLKTAAKAWAGATLNIQRFANAYVDGLKADESAAQLAFAAAYPMFGPREWKRFALVGYRRLLPQFVFKSDAFVGKLLRRSDSLDVQNALVSASELGLLRVDRGQGPVSVTLDTLTDSEEKALTFLLNTEDAKLKPAQLIAKFRSMVATVNRQTQTWKVPLWEVKTSGTRVYVKLNRATTLDRSEVAELLDALDGRGEKTAKREQSASVLLTRLVDAIADLEALRDEEWDFEEQNGIRESWTGKTCRTHERLLARIQRSRRRVNDLARAAIGSDNLNV